MSALSPPPGIDPTSTLKLVARHLVAAEACALRAAATTPDLGDVAVGAALLTSQVLSLLPPEEVVDDVATPHGDDVGALLRAAEQLTRAHPDRGVPTRDIGVRGGPG